jgi:hypothetical protein
MYFVLLVNSFTFNQYKNLAWQLILKYKILLTSQLNQNINNTVFMVKK